MAFPKPGTNLYDSGVNAYPEGGYGAEDFIPGVTDAQNPYGDLLGGGTGGGDPSGGYDDTINSGTGGYTTGEANPEWHYNPPDGSGGAATSTDSPTGVGGAGAGGAPGGGTFTDSGGAGGGGGQGGPGFPPMETTGTLVGGGAAPGERDMTREESAEFSPFQTSVSPHRGSENNLLSYYEQLLSGGFGGINDAYNQQLDQQIEKQSGSLFDRGIGSRSGLAASNEARMRSEAAPGIALNTLQSQMGAMQGMGGAISGFGRDTFTPTRTKTTTTEKGQTGGAGATIPSGYYEGGIRLR